jgi:hypothetical protein
MKTTIIIFLVLILLIILIILFKLSHLNKQIFPCGKINYNTVTSSDDSLKGTSKYLLNFVTSAYNDVCKYPLFTPDKVPVDNIYHLTATVSTLWFKSTNNAGLVYIFNDSIIVSFRGTYFRGDEIIDAEFNSYTYPGTTVSVHTGFHKYFDSLKDQLFDIIGKNSGKKVFITGHSLGASTALIAGYELLNKFPGIDLNIYVFGCPKTGNLDFVQSFKKANVVSIVNYFDIVPESPEKINNKLYSVMPIYIFGIEQNSDITNHSIAIYNQGIDVMQPLDATQGVTDTPVKSGGGAIPPKNILRALF